MTTQVVTLPTLDDGRHPLRAVADTYGADIGSTNGRSGRWKSLHQLQRNLFDIDCAFLLSQQLRQPPR
jgi:hypothetical protein